MPANFTIQGWDAAANAWETIATVVNTANGTQTYAINSDSRVSFDLPYDAYGLPFDKPYAGFRIAVTTTVGGSSNGFLNINELQFFVKSLTPVSAPELDDYYTAGVSGVSVDNILAVNAQMRLATLASNATHASLQNVVTLAEQAIAYLRDHLETDPAEVTIADLQAVGITGVDEFNLPYVKAALYGASNLADKDSSLELNAIAQQGISVYDARLQVVKNYADNDAPTWSYAADVTSAGQSISAAANQSTLTFSSTQETSTAYASLTIDPLTFTRPDHPTLALVQGFDSSAPVGNQWVTIETLEVIEKPLIAWNFTSGSNAQGFTVTSSSALTGYDAWEAMDAVSAQTRSDAMWVSAAPASRSAPQWIQIDLSGSEVVTAYSLQADPIGAREPRAWSLQGSNDGSSWVTVDSRNQQATWTDQTSNSYDVAQPGAYAHYRLLMTEGNDVTQVALDGLQLYARTFAPKNLITNGDFESGDVGFETSFNSVTRLSESASRTYTVDDDALMRVGLSGALSGNALWVSGSATDTKHGLVWSQTVNAVPGQTYAFSYDFLQGVSPYGKVEVMINGVSLGTYQPTSPGWTRQTASVVAPSNGVFDIAIMSLTASETGNDFALDNIAMVAALPALSERVFDSYQVVLSNGETTLQADDVSLVLAPANNARPAPALALLADLNIANVLPQNLQAYQQRIAMLTSSDISSGQSVQDIVNSVNQGITAIRSFADAEDTTSNVHALTISAASASNATKVVSAASNVLDGFSYTNYQISNGAGEGLLLTLDSAQIVEAIRLGSGTAAGNMTPQTFSLYGSATALGWSDAGWTPLTTQQSTLLSGTAFDSEVTRIPAGSAFQYYKLVFDSVKSAGSALQVSSVELFGATGWSSEPTLSSFSNAGIKNVTENNIEGVLNRLAQLEATDLGSRRRLCRFTGVCQ